MIRPASNHMESAAKTSQSRVVVGLLVVAGLLLVALANTHLVYVAFESQPDCVPHFKHGSVPEGAGLYRAARSAC